MSAKVLAHTVYLTDDDGAVLVHEAGSVPPAAVAKKITNPAAWVEEASAAAAEEASPDQVVPDQSLPERMSQ